MISLCSWHWAREPLKSAYHPCYSIETALLRFKITYIAELMAERQWHWYHLTCQLFLTPCIITFCYKVVTGLNQHEHIRFLHYVTILYYQDIVYLFPWWYLVSQCINLYYVFHWLDLEFNFPSFLVDPLTFHILSPPPLYSVSRYRRK